MYDSKKRGKMHNHRSREDIPRKAQTIQFSDAMKEPTGTVETVEIKNQSKCPCYMYSVFHPDLSCTREVRDTASHGVRAIEREHLSRV